MTTYSNALYNYKAGLFRPSNTVSFRTSEPENLPGVGLDSAKPDTKNEKFTTHESELEKLKQTGKRKVPIVYTHSRPSNTESVINRFRPEDVENENNDKNKDINKKKKSKIYF